MISRLAPPGSGLTKPHAPDIRPSEPEAQVDSVQVGGWSRVALCALPLVGLMAGCNWPARRLPTVTHEVVEPASPWQPRVGSSAYTPLVRLDVSQESGVSVSSNDEGRWLVAGDQGILLDGELVTDGAGSRIRVGGRSVLSTMNPSGKWVVVGRDAIVVNGDLVVDSEGHPITVGDGGFALDINEKGDWIVAGRGGLVHNGELLKDQQGKPLEVWRQASVDINNRGDWIAAGGNGVYVNGYAFRDPDGGQVAWSGVALVEGDDWMVVTDNRSLRGKLENGLPVLKFTAVPDAKR